MQALLDENTDAADLTFALEPLPTASSPAAAIRGRTVMWLAFLGAAGVGLGFLVKSLVDDSTG